MQLIFQHIIYIFIHSYNFLFGLHSQGWKCLLHNFTSPWRPTYRDRACHDSQPKVATHGNAIHHPVQGVLGHWYPEIHPPIGSETPGNNEATAMLTKGQTDSNHQLVHQNMEQNNNESLWTNPRPKRVELVDGSWSPLSKITPPKSASGE